ncbi:hypothetical protein BDV93DRAFT_541592 [Ceratobasidium sp. AG-I]|nr:hypothetical protein BDV93DRAFT_541592 [Ceratobasidium sp. AG-I]
MDKQKWNGVAGAVPPNFRPLGARAAPKFFLLVPWPDGSRSRLGMALNAASDNRVERAVPAGSQIAAAVGGRMWGTTMRHFDMSPPPGYGSSDGWEPSTSETTDRVQDEATEITRLNDWTLAGRPEDGTEQRRMCSSDSSVTEFQPADNAYCTLALLLSHLPYTGHWSDVATEASAAPDGMKRLHQMPRYLWFRTATICKKHHRCTRTITAVNIVQDRPMDGRQRAHTQRDRRAEYRSDRLGANPFHRGRNMCPAFLGNLMSEELGIRGGGPCVLVWMAITRAEIKIMSEESVAGTGAWLRLSSLGPSPFVSPTESSGRQFRSKRSAAFVCNDEKLEAMRIARCGTAGDVRDAGARDSPSAKISGRGRHSKNYQYWLHVLGTVRHYERNSATRPLNV